MGLVISNTTSDEMSKSDTNEQAETIKFSDSDFAGSQFLKFEGMDNVDQESLEIHEKALTFMYEDDQLTYEEEAFSKNFGDLYTFHYWV